jgi:hypothetical protein
MPLPPALHRFWHLLPLRPTLPGLVLATGSLGLGGMVLCGCASTPVKMECQEQRLRLEYEDLSEDQRRFGEAALSDCEGRLDTAQTRDSLFIEKLNQSFTPEDTP